MTMATFKDDSGRMYRLTVDGATGLVVKTFTDGSGRRPEAAKGLPSPAYDPVKCPTCQQIGPAHSTVGERCPGLAKAKEAPRVCPNCGHENPPAKDDTANTSRLCYGCGSPLNDDEEPSMEKRQAEQTRYLADMARSSHSEIARRGQDALARQLGPIVAADIISTRSTK